MKYKKIKKTLCTRVIIVKILTKYIWVYSNTRGQ